MSLIIDFKKINEDAVLPSKNNDTDAGFDITTIDNYTMRSGEFRTFNTGLQLADYKSDNNSYLRIAPRSGMAVRDGINVLAGVVDKSFRGEIKVVLHNNSNHSVQISKGDRIAQMIPTLIEQTKVRIVKDVKKTTRGTKGFGSSGK